MDNNTKQQIEDIVSNEFNEMDFSAIKSEQDITDNINNLFDINLIDVIFGFFGCTEEDIKCVKDIIRKTASSKYHDYLDSQAEDDYLDGQDDCRNNDSEPDPSPKQKYCEYVCNEICYNAAQSEEGYTPNTRYLSTDAIKQLHDITRGYFLDSFRHIKDDYIVNTSKKELRGLYDTLFDFAGYIYNK